MDSKKKKLKLLLLKGEGKGWGETMRGEKSIVGIKLETV